MEPIAAIVVSAGIVTATAVVRAKLLHLALGRR